MCLLNIHNITSLYNPFSLPVKVSRFCRFKFFIKSLHIFLHFVLPLFRSLCHLRWFSSSLIPSSHFQSMRSFVSDQPFDCFYDILTWNDFFVIILSGILVKCLNHWSCDFCIVYSKHLTSNCILKVLFLIVSLLGLIYVFLRNLISCCSTFDCQGLWFIGVR